MNEAPAALRPVRYGITVDPLAELYARLFEGEAPRALVSLEPEHVDRLVDLGAVTAEVAAASVLLAYRLPGIVGSILAVPRERYDGLRVLEAFAEKTEGTCPR